MAKRSRKKSRPPVNLPEDLLVEVLARVPYSSLCRFKCVSRSWLALCSVPDLRRRSPKALSGFFCYDRDGTPSFSPADYFCYAPTVHNIRFVSLPGKGRRPVDPGLQFLRHGLRVSRSRLHLVHCCNGLLLCRCYTASLHPKDTDWVVCSPATEKWTVLPATAALRLNFPNFITVRLGFHPAFPSRFHVFVIKQDSFARGRITGVEIYSSETGLWTSNISRWSRETCLNQCVRRCVFFNSTLHLTTFRPSAPAEDVCSQDSTCDCDHSLVTVDTEGKTWRKFPMPYHDKNYGSIGQSQGRLYAMHIDQKNGYLLSVWVLEDYGTGQWTLMHTANVHRLFGRHCRSEEDFYYLLIAIHPECNLIFLIDGVTSTLVSYDMDERKMHDICNINGYYFLPFQPYAPCFAEWSPNGN